MHFANVVDPDTLEDAMQTYKSMFKVQSHKPMTLQYRNFAIDEFLKRPLANAGLHRLRRKQPFPVYDRPRGQADLDSLKYLKSTSNLLSPIIVLKEKSAWTVLDGVHRLIAAHQTNSQIRVALLIPIIAEILDDPHFRQTPTYLQAKHLHM